MARRILVVGGAGAIGRAYGAKAMAQGDLVATLDLQTSITQAGMEGHDLVFPIDVSDPASIADAFARLGEAWDVADALIYLSGYTLSPPRPAEDVTEREWTGVIDVNLSGAFRVAMASLPLLRAGAGGSIVLVSSAMAFGPVKGFAPYIASKAGMIGLTRSLALELAPAIRVNALAPSAMETPFAAGGTGRSDPNASADWFAPEAFIPTIPLGRLAQVDDCLGTLDYLVGQDSAFVTGQVLHINGGRQMR